MDETPRKDRPKKMLGVLDHKYILKLSENYRGLSYNDIIIRWQRWLLCDSPDRNQFGDILFLRGSVGYHQSSTSYLHSSAVIPGGVAILVPIVTTFYTIGEKYKGKMIKNEFYLRKAVREHVDSAGPFWATLSFNDNKVVKLVRNLTKFRLESMIFEIEISDLNPFLDKMDEPISAGKRTGLVSGYFVLLHDLSIGTYKIRFGGYGMDRFYTEALYKIKIEPKKLENKDASGPNFSPEHILKEKRNPVSI